MVARGVARVFSGWSLGVARWLPRVFWVVARALLGGC